MEHAATGDEFRFTDLVRSRDLHLLPWTARIDGVEAGSVDLVKEDDQGRLLEVRVTMRPFEAIQALREAMRQRTGRWQHHNVSGERNESRPGRE